MSKAAQTATRGEIEPSPWIQETLLLWPPSDRTRRKTIERPRPAATTEPGLHRDRRHWYRGEPRAGDAYGCRPHRVNRRVVHRRRTAPFRGPDAAQATHEPPQVLAGLDRP